MRRLLRRHSPDLVFVAACCIVVAVRARHLAWASAPPGFDGGDWLALGRGVFGDDVRPPGVIAVPLAPLLTFVVVTMLGSNVGFVLLSASLSCAPAVGAYVVLRQLVHPPPALLLAGLLLTGGAAGEAASWGGYPQLMGLGILPIVVFLADRSLRSASHKTTLVAGGALLALALASDLVFALGLASVASLLITHFAQSPARYLTLLRTSSILALPLVVAAPIYARLLGARVSAVTDPITPAEVGPNLWSRLEAVWFDAPIVWRALALAALITLPLLWSHRRNPAWRIGVAIIGPSVVAVCVWPETRLAYFLPTGVVMASAIWAQQEVVPRSSFAVAFFAVALVGQVAVFPSSAFAQARRYQALTSDHVVAMNWLRSGTDPSATLVVTPFRDAPPVAWWVEGLARRRTLAASSTAWIYFPVERENAAKAARVLSAGTPTPQTLSIARRYRADFVFVDKRWDEYQSGRVANLRRTVPGVVAFENDGVVILRTGSALSARTRR